MNKLLRFKTLASALFVLDYYRKLCATCHLWKRKNDLPGEAAFFNEKEGAARHATSGCPKGMNGRPCRTQMITKRFKPDGRSVDG